jgi:hypothetical protein
MDKRSTDTPEQVLKFAPKEKPRDDGDPTDQSGRAVVALLQQAANLSNENCDRAMSLAHKLSIQLRAAEDQINQLRSDVEHYQKRAAHAERWLERIQKEIEDKLIAPRAGSRPEQALLQ